MELSHYQELVHLIATPVFLIVYSLRLVYLLRSRFINDRSPDPKGEIGKGIWDAFITIVMPWKMDSTRRHWFYYLVFIGFHIGLAFNIALSYLVTYTPEIMTAPVRAAFSAVIFISLVAGIIRFVRRLYLPEMRIISTMDDYFALFIVLLYNIAGLVILQGSAWGSYAYFTIVFIFLIYEPFSKINHYFYYPFARYFYGIDTARKGTLKSEESHA